MPTRRTLCVFRSGESFWASPSEVEEILKYEEGVQDGDRIVMSPIGSGGPRSSRVGQYLAAALRRRKPWARVMLEQIER